jgi:hypothetical protein
LFSHPCRKKPRQGWGTQYLPVEEPESKSFDFTMDDGGLIYAGQNNDLNQR